MNCLFGEIWKGGKDVKEENVSDIVCPDFIEKKTEKIRKEKNNVTEQGINEA